MDRAKQEIAMSVFLIIAHHKLNTTHPKLNKKWAKTTQKETGRIHPWIPCTTRHSLRQDPPDYEYVSDKTLITHPDDPTDSTTTSMIFIERGLLGTSAQNVDIHNRHDETSSSEQDSMLGADSQGESVPPTTPDTHIPTDRNHKTSLRETIAQMRPINPLTPKGPTNMLAQMRPTNMLAPTGLTKTLAHQGAAYNLARMCQLEQNGIKHPRKKGRKPQAK